MANRIGSRHRMRISVFLVLMVLWPVRASADVQWHKFGVAGHKETIALGRVTLTVEAQKAADSGFPGDDLIITAQTPGQEPSQYYFTSSYGYGSVAIHGNTLLLKYGVGRGTAGARVEHVKALRLDHDLGELVDVQCSYWIVTNPHNAGPDLFEYHLKIQTEGGYTTLSFSLPKPRYGLLSEKIVRWKNDD